jgi:hypothetical protein
MKSIVGTRTRPGSASGSAPNIVWGSYTLPATKSIVEVVFEPSAGKFLAFPQTTTTILTSTDSVNWRNYTISGGSFFSTAAVGPSGTVICGTGIAGSTFLFSTDSGASFGLRGTGIGDSCYRGVFYADGYYYTAGYQMIASSTTGAAGIPNWSTGSVGPAGNIEAVFAGKGKKYGVPLGGYIYTAPKDNDVWTYSFNKSLDGKSLARRSLAEFNGVFFLCDSNGIFTSQDFVNWTWGAGTSGSIVNRIAYGNNTYVATVYNSDYALVSRDGSNWYRSTLPSTANWNAVAFGSGTFVVMAYGGNIVVTGTVLG